MSTQIRVERDVAIRMKDGITLRADVYRPDIPAPVPALLERTPYGKAYAQTSFALVAAERGYAAIIQDTRGRWASEGENYPLAHEKEDGYDTIAWIASQPWCNGRVGMFGGSYLGYTQMAAAAAQPPALKTIAPFVAFSNPYTITFPGGAFALGSQLAWGLLSITQMDILRLSVQNPAEKAPLWGQWIGLVDGMASRATFSVSPLSRLPLVGTGGLNPALVHTLEHTQYDSYWKAFTCPLERIHLPAFHIGGWYDPFLSATLHDFSTLQGGTKPGESHPPQKLLIGPWTHGTFDNLGGEVDFGIQASGLLVVPDELHLRWFDHWLKDLPTGIMDEPPVRIFVMGENRWRDEGEWPLARTRFIPYYLHSQGGASTAAGDGLLSPELPGQEPPDRFEYDPNNPVPTCGGALLGWEAALPPGAYDQRPVETRPDVLVYTTPPLDQDLEVTGPLQVHLWAASSAIDTDFTAKLVDVAPDGYARNLQDGILRARSRIPDEVTLLKPEEITALTLDLSATSNLFKAGHRVRLEISSSNFPRFDRNPNTGEPAHTATHFIPARQTIFHDQRFPSCIILPTIP